MKVLFLDWACFSKEDTIEAIEGLGHEVIKFSHPEYNVDVSEAFVADFLKFVEKENVEACFSYNYYPPLSEGCHQADLPYISFVYDSPYVMLYSFTLMYPTNHVFLFDTSWVDELRMGGLTNVYYMVLPGNAKRIEKMLVKSYDKKRLSADVSFVGALYNEKHNFYERLTTKAPQYLKGYLDGIVEAQQKVYGYSLVEELLSDDIMSMMRDVLDAKPGATYAEPPKYRYANYFIKRRITQLERIRLLTEVGKTFGDTYSVKLFTMDKSFSPYGIQNMGIAKYETEMPLVFHDSRINLNISLRSIHTGIPLRCIDIMANGGFLMTNYQSDMFIDFVPGEEFAYFESCDDLLEKTEYYLSHDRERLSVAKAGQQKIRDYFSFDAVFSRIFAQVFG